MGKSNRRNDMDRFFNGGGEKQGVRCQTTAALSTSLFVHNIALETSANDIHTEFERFGPIRDVYLPKEFSTQMPKGYGFIKFQYGEDAKMAKEHLNHRMINGQEISIEYSSDANRKKPGQMDLIKSRIRKRDRLEACHQSISSLLSGKKRPRTIVHLSLPFGAVMDSAKVLPGYIDDDVLTVYLCLTLAIYCISLGYYLWSMEPPVT